MVMSITIDLLGYVFVGWVTFKIQRNIFSIYPLWKRVRFGWLRWSPIFGFALLILALAIGQPIRLSFSGLFFIGAGLFFVVAVKIKNMLNAKT